MSKLPEDSVNVSPVFQKRIKELVADKMTPEEIKQELSLLLLDNTYCKNMIAGYADMAERLGSAGAPARAAHIMTTLLHNKYNKV